MSMVDWPDVACRRGHISHALHKVTVTLDGPTPYHDLAPIPHELATSFVMYLWDTLVHPVDGGPYCPAHDAVSETIAMLGVWEPAETILALETFRHAAPEAVFVDVGAQIGYYSLSAAANGVRAVAFEADELNAQMIQGSAELNGFDIDVRWQRIDQHSEPFDATVPVCLAKVDVEGAERYAVDMLWPAIEAGNVANLLIEVSPCFGPGYPELVERIVHAGYTAYTLPPKRVPPVPLAGVADLWPGRIDRTADLRHLVAGWHQEDVWFRRRA